AMNSNQPPQRVSGSADVMVRIHNGGTSGGDQVYDTEMLSMNLSGGSLPNGVMIRESPTRASLGETRIMPVTGGYMISSFFDVFTEISLDGGNTWSPSDTSGHMELQTDPATYPTVIMQPHIVGGQPTLTIQTQIGLKYLIQYKNNLDDSQWLMLGTIYGEGTEITIKDTLSSGVPHRFYRAQVQEDDR